MQEASNTNAANTADCQMPRSQQAIIKPKNYKVKNTAWYCSQCDIYCNSKSQFEVHMISIKHSQTLEGKLSGQQEGAVVVEESDAASNHNHLVPESTIDQQTSQSVVYTIEEANCDQAMLDENNNHVSEETMAVTTTVLANGVVKRKIDINNFDIADQFKVNARAYLIPESKRIGKFEKFGFYCSKCDAYMTGQIQLVMHIKGAKHQYYSPGELPDYQPSKAYNPNNTGGHYHSRRRSAAAASQHELSHEQMMMKLVAANTMAAQFIRMPPPPPPPQPQPQPLPTFINLPLHPHYHHGSTAASTSYTIQMAQAAAALANQRRAFLKSLASIGQPQPQPPQPQPQAHPSYIDYLFKFNEQQQQQSMVQHQQETHSHNLPAVTHLYHHHHPYPAANITPPAQNQSADIVSQHFTQQQPSHLYHHPYTNGLNTNNGGANNGFRLVSAITATTTSAATNTSNSMQQVIATANNQSPKQQQQSQYCFDPNQQQHSPNIDLVKSKPITMINNGNNEAQMSCETCLNDYQNSGVGIMFNQTGGSSQMPYFQAANSNGNNGHCFTYV